MHWSKKQKWDQPSYKTAEQTRCSYYAEVAHLFMDSGHIVVSTSNTFGLADHRLIHTLVGEGSAVLTVHVGGEPDQEADLVLPAGAVPEEAVIAIGDLLRTRNILLGL